MATLYLLYVSFIIFINGKTHFLHKLIAQQLIQIFYSINTVCWRMVFSSSTPLVTVIIDDSLVDGSQIEDCNIRVNISKADLPRLISAPYIVMWENLPLDYLHHTDTCTRLTFSQCIMAGSPATIWRITLDNEQWMVNNKQKGIMQVVIG